MLKALSRVLREEGWSVETFESAEAFLARRDPNAEGCLVLDVTMPGLDGLELQRRLAAAGESLPIVFVTGHGDIPMSVRAIKAGATDFLTKPVQAAGAGRRGTRRDRSSRFGAAGAGGNRGTAASGSPASRRASAKCWRR